MTVRDHLAMYREYYSTRIVERRASIWLPRIETLAQEHGVSSVIDFGSGAARGLEFSKKLQVTSYDPGVVGLGKIPAPQHMVASVHMMEHLERAQDVDGVLAQMESLATKVVFIVVSCKPSSKILPDGTAWHTLVRPPDWWSNKFGERYVSQDCIYPSKEYAALWVKPHTECPHCVDGAVHTLEHEGKP